MKNLFIDIETTGTDKDKHGIIQIAGIVEIDGCIKKEFDLKVRPFEFQECEKAALALHGIKEEDLRKYPLPSNGYSVLVSILDQYVNKFDKVDKFFFVGYNATFDFDFLVHFFLNNNDRFYGSYFFWPTVDVAVLAGYLLRKEKHLLANSKLVTVAEYLGVVGNGEAHDAAYDIKLTYRIFKFLEDKIPEFTSDHGQKVLQRRSRWKNI